MKLMSTTRLGRGFALPTIMISSLVMLVVMLTAVQASTSVSSGLQTQYYNKLASDAARAGMLYAEACLSLNGGAVSWNANPLRPNSGCSGGTSCPITSQSDSCWIVKNGNVRSTFSVGAPAGGNATSLTSVGRVDIVRTSSGESWRSYQQTVRRTESVVAPADSSLKWKQLSTGVNFTCALTVRGYAYCWGLNDKGQLGNNSTTNRLLPSPVAGGRMYTAISSSSSHTCGLAVDGWLYCWGGGANSTGSGTANGNFGQLGNGDTNRRLVPTAVTTTTDLTGKTFKSISVNQYNSCGVASDNRAYCWGFGTNGALGNGSTTQSVTTPVLVSQPFAGALFIQVSVGRYHTCAIISNGNGYCWGHAANGKLGNNTTTPNQLTPQPINTTNLGSLKIKSLSVGYAHTCAIADNNNTYCWGEGGYGKLGRNLATDTLIPTAITSSSPSQLSGRSIEAVSPGYNHTCARTSDSKAYCWGYNGNRELGDGTTTTQSLTAVAVAQGAIPSAVVGLVDISAGYTHSCLIASDNRIYCWGNNDNGQLGDSSTTPRSIPTATTPVSDANTTKITQQIAAGQLQTCALDSDSWVHCWGNNTSGQLGDSTNTQSTTPVAIKYGDIPSGIVLRKVASGKSHTCAVGSDGKAYCWGYNNKGQLGDNTNTNRSTPTAVSMVNLPVGASILDISAGDEHTCVLGSDYRVYCWGSNGNRQLATSVSTYADQARVPILVSSIANVRSISAGGFHTCVITTSYLPYCWGNNDFSQATASSTNTTNPIVSAALISGGAIPSGTLFSQISAGGWHTCAVAVTGKAYCWGNGGNGRLGLNNSTSDSRTPIEVTSSFLFSTIAASKNNHTCAMTTTYRAYCWGENSQGELGVNSTTYVYTAPAAVSSPLSSAITQIDTGWNHTCGILASNQRAYCWGNNTSGKLGIGDTSLRRLPVMVSAMPGLSLSSYKYYY